MKKAKIMLTAITVMAIVGGALAFKAKTPRTYFTLDTANKCKKPIQLQFTTAGTPTTSIFATNVSFEGTSGIETAPCYTLDVRFDQ